MTKKKLQNQLNFTLCAPVSEYQEKSISLECFEMYCFAAMCIMIFALKQTKIVTI